MKIILGIIGITIAVSVYSQTYTQYFDTPYNPTDEYSIKINIDNSPSNIWQIGPPQKAIFNSAATPDKALVTDTINNYPNDNTSSFTFTIKPFFITGILAIQWKQKLDMDKDFDGGIIEYSVDGGSSWVNVFNNPYVYNFYGFDLNNKDTLSSTGEYSFSGTDNEWKDIWLCFHYSWLSYNDSIIMKYTLKSDNINNNKEGWIIDNLQVHPTYVHTVNKPQQKEYIKIHPIPTNGIINIQIKDIDNFHIIEKMELINNQGKVVQEYGVSPTKFYIDISNHPGGIYFLKIKTNKKTETFRVVLQEK